MYPALTDASDFVCCWKTQDLSIEVGGIGVQGPEGLFDPLVDGEPPLPILRGDDISAPSNAIGITLRGHTNPHNGSFVKVFEEPVPSERGAYVMEHVTSVPRVYSLVHAAIPASGESEESASLLSVPFPDLPAFGEIEALSGVYRLMIIEYPEHKTIYTDDPACWEGTLEGEAWDEFCITEEPYTDQDFLEWYEHLHEGPSSEFHAPLREVSFEFEYEARTIPAYVCCSNILFLPGIMGSRLYEGENRIWEPSGEDDVKGLYLDEQGNNPNPSIEARAVVDTFDGPLFFDAPIYESFFEDLEYKKQQGVIADYATVPYDWRLSYDDILSDGRIADELRRLAASSKTGKVTIVSHSNGGLVSKTLLSTLGDEASLLVDQLILVAVPQIGTPQAIGMLLHGFDGGIPFRITAEAVRDMSRTMPGAYQLIPHPEYYDRRELFSRTPPVSFEEGAATNKFIEQYGFAISSSDELDDFLTGVEGRSTPPYDDLKNPGIGSDFLLSAAHSITRVVGSLWQVPTGINVHQIAGIGEDTLAGIRYMTGKRCNSMQLGLSGCFEYDDQLLYAPVETIDGDGTVVAPSALAMNEGYTVKQWWVDLHEHNQGSRSNPYLVHKDILEIREVRDLIFENIMTQTESVLPQYISDTKPEIDTGRRLIFILHSPLSLRAIDEEGNEAAESISTIQGARYKQYGEVQVITVPADVHPTIRLDGEAEGSFTLEMMEYDGNDRTAYGVFTGIPTFIETKASISFPDGTLEGASDFTIDYDGDGADDMVLEPSLTEPVTPPVVLDTIDEPEYVRTKNRSRAWLPQVQGMFSSINTADFIFSTNVPEPSEMIFRAVHGENIELSQNDSVRERPVVIDENTPNEPPISAGWGYRLIQAIKNFFRGLFTFLSFSL